MSDIVLLTGARAPVAQDLARSFRAAGMEIHLADSVTPWAARGLRPKVPIHRLPPPRHAFAEFRAALARLADDLGVTLVVPTCEEVFWVAAAAGLDGYADRVFAPPLSVLRRLHSKIEFPALLRACGLPAPESWALASSDDLARLPLSPGETVLKPEFSRFATQVIVQPDKRRMASIAPSPARRWVAQRFVPGQEICSWAIARVGEIVAIACYRPRWRHGRSAAYAFEAIDAPAVAELSRRIARATDFTGHLSFDLIVTPDGTTVPIECNPRAVSGLHLFDGDPGLARAIMGKGSVTSPPAGRLRYLSPAMALLGLPSALAQGRIGKLLADWQEGEDALGRAGDRLPVWGALIDGARFAVTGLRGGGAARQTTADIEWDGEEIA